MVNSVSADRSMANWEMCISSSAVTVIGIR
jgi:hypothetical protein